MDLQVNRLSEVLGAEVIGADLSRQDDDAQAAALHKALLDNGIIVIRDQHISPDDHIAFSRRFGELSVHVLTDFQLPGYPVITCISNKRENGKAVGIADAGRHWHSDQAYERIPAMGSLLHAQEIPPEGGDTLGPVSQHQSAVMRAAGAGISFQKARNLDAGTNPGSHDIAHGRIERIVLRQHLDR